MTARRPRRLAALLSVVPVLVATTALVAAPQANAFSGDAAVECVVFFGGDANNNPLFPSAYGTETFALNFTGSAGAFTATLSGATGLTNGPAPIAAGQFAAVRAKLVWEGGSTTISKTSPYPAAAVAANGRSGPWSITGSVPAPAGATVTVQQLVFDSTGTGVDIYCSGGSTPSGGATVNHKTNPVNTSIAEVTDGSAPSGSSSSSPSGSPTPTDTGSPTPTGTGSPTPTSTGSPTSSASPTTSTTPPSSSVTPVTVTGLSCEILGQAKAWTAPALSSGTPSADPKFSFGADKLTVTKGQKVNFTLSYDQGPAVGPVTIPKGTLKPMAKVKVSGAGAGTVILVGPVNAADIVGYAEGNATGWNAGQTLKGSFTATADGTVTAVLDEVAFDYGDPGASTSFGWPTKVEDLDSVCNKGTAPKTAAVSIALEAQEGTVPTPSPTPSTSTSTTTTDDTDTDTDDTGDDGNNGTLAATGPGEAFQAMIWALVALQVGLIIVVRMARRRPVPASASSTRVARRRTPGQPWARSRGRHR